VQTEKVVTASSSCEIINFPAITDSHLYVVEKNLDCGNGLREYVALALVVYLVLSYLWKAFYVAVLTESEQRVAREVKSHAW
jgi:hypothetical protein